MKRQSSTRSRKGNLPENTNTHHSHTIGCMSGLFRLLSSRRRKSITFGKKHEKNVKPSESVILTSKTDVSPSSQRQEAGVGNEKQNQAKSVSANIPRSPTLSAEIRSPPPAMVAKLMGLQDDLSCCSLTPESAAEKRRLLLGALEKCDQDLKTLKRIIEVVKISVGGGADDSCSDKDGGCSQPSSVPAVDSYYSRRCTDGRTWRPQQQRRPGEEDMVTASRFTERITAESIYHAPKSLSPERPFWARKAMAESVEQVCRDIEWGERRELNRIGLALQDYICRDLIEEIVNDMGCRCNIAFTSLPLDACKRRLSF